MLIELMVLAAAARGAAWVAEQVGDSLSAGGREAEAKREEDTQAVHRARIIMDDPDAFPLDQVCRAREDLRRQTSHEAENNARLIAQQEEEQRRVQSAAERDRAARERRARKAERKRQDLERERHQRKERLLARETEQQRDEQVRNRERATAAQAVLADPNSDALDHAWARSVLGREQP